MHFTYTVNNKRPYRDNMVSYNISSNNTFEKRNKLLIQTGGAIIKNANGELSK